jgi:ech hydrogenase subunit D
MDGPAFLDRIAAYKRDGWRLVVINAVSILPSEDATEGAYEVIWTFARGHELEHLREHLQRSDRVPSVAPSYPNAFTYENELRELFGIDVTGIAVDLGGHLYKTAERVPFSPGAIRARLEASGRIEPARKMP